LEPDYGWKIILYFIPGEIVYASAVKSDMPNSSISELNRILVGGAVLQPEYATIRIATALFGIPRTELFRLIAEDKIRSVHYTKKGAKKGIRLIRLDSLRAYLETFAESGR
jgi:hypothetical protein